MARHLTLADIGRGMSRHRAPRSRLHVVLVALISFCLLSALAGAGLALRPWPWIGTSADRSTGTSAGAIARAPTSAGASGSAAPGAAPAEAGAPVRAGCDRGTTELVMASSVDKSSLLARFAAEFSRTGMDAAGRCVVVHVVPKASGAAMTELSQGWPTEPKPDVWSPSGAIWLPLLEARLAAGHRSSLVATPGSAPSIATSPMVIAMPRPMAEAMGWPTAAIGWSDLYRLGSSRTGWGAFGHPEWGPFLLGKTNPNFSHAGLEGTVATYYAAVGRTSGLTPADLRRAETRRFVAGVEQSIARYGDTTLSYSADWRRADDAGQAMSYLSALVTEENLVASYNDGNPLADPDQAGRNAKPKVPLVAVYPKEGTFFADHPYAVLGAPWVTDAKRAAAQAFLNHLLSPAVQLAFQANYFRDARGRAGTHATTQIGLVPQQPTTLLEVPSPATTSAILEGWSQLRKTANVISLLDVSGSMAQPLPGSAQTRLQAAKQAVTGSLQLYTDADEVGLWSFSGGRRGVQDWTELVPVGPMTGTVRGTQRRTALRQAIGRLEAHGDTGLYNSIAAAYDAVLARYDADRINALIVLTDGRNDAQGGLDLAQLLARLTADAAGRRVRVFTIAYGPDADAATLARIARATGGASYVAPGPAEIPKVYAAALSNV
jgi:Ca-activated chloride channel family protein